MENMIEQEMVILVAPDGAPQPSTLAMDMAQCLGFLKFLHKSGMGDSPAKLMFRGFKILPVKVTIAQIGTEEDAFRQAKSKL